jgi:26S proteasome regulatory subunit N2
MLFAQHWYWYPMLNFINLALTPTAIIGINDKLKVPKSFKSISNAKPSFYKYPEMLKADDGKKKEKVTVAVLSTTTKAKARKDRKDGKTGNEPESPVPKDTEMANEESKKEGEEGEKKEEDKKDEPEPDFQELKNPSRVLKQ